MKHISILTLIAATTLACTDDENAVRTLRAHGFTDIVTTGYEPFGCSKDDTYSTGFTAKNAQGVNVSGVVCCGMGWGKGCTVRF